MDHFMYTYIVTLASYEEPANELHVHVNVGKVCTQAKWPITEQEEN